MPRKLSASGLALYLKSPKAYFFRYIAGWESAERSVSSFDHDKEFGTQWANFVDRFYKRVNEAENTQVTRQAFLDATDGWCPEKPQSKLLGALDALMPQYYQQFSPEDGVRTAQGSELWLENDRFVGRLDGLSADGWCHEVKSTSRSPQISQQLWRVGNSIQVKLYCVLAKAQGYVIEFCWKDLPHAIFRGPQTEVTPSQRNCWEHELNALADHITSLGDDPCNYPCNPEGCSIASKNFVSKCWAQDLCDGLPEDIVNILYKKRENRS